MHPAYHPSNRRRSSSTALGEQQQQQQQQQQQTKMQTLAQSMLVQLRSSQHFRSISSSPVVILSPVKMQHGFSHDPERELLLESKHPSPKRKQNQAIDDDEVKQRSSKRGKALRAEAHTQAATSVKSQEWTASAVAFSGTTAAAQVAESRQSDPSAASTYTYSQDAPMAQTAVDFAASPFSAKSNAVLILPADEVNAVVKADSSSWRVPETEEDEEAEDRATSLSGFFFCCGSSRPSAVKSLSVCSPGSPLSVGSVLPRPSFDSPSASLLPGLTSSSPFPVSPYVPTVSSTLGLSASASSPIRVPVHMTAQRLKVIEEIQSTERAYVDALFDVITHFMEPLKVDSSKLGITGEHIAHIFSNLTVLAQFHSLFLSDLTKPGVRIAEVFMQLSDFLKMYTQYLNGYEKSIATLNSLRANRNVQKLFKEKEILLKGRGLMALLIMPVQRIPRYVLLLRELKRHTPAHHTESEQLNDALAKIEAIASHVNESKRHAENMLRLLDIQSRLGDSTFVLFQPDRRLLREDVLHRLKEDYVLSSSLACPLANGGGEEEVEEEEQLVFVFNDLLLWTSPLFAITGSVPLSELQYLPTKLPLLPTTIWLARKGKPLSFDMVFRCKNMAEHDEWTSFLQATIHSACGLASAATMPSGATRAVSMWEGGKPQTPLRVCTPRRYRDPSSLAHGHSAHGCIKLVTDVAPIRPHDIQSPRSARLELEF